MAGTAGLSILESSASCNGVTKIITTPQNPGESDSAHEARHQAKVDRYEADCSGIFAMGPSTYTTPVTCPGEDPVDVENTKAGGDAWAPFFATHATDVKAAIDACT